MCLLPPRTASRLLLIPYLLPAASWHVLAHLHTLVPHACSFPQQALHKVQPPTISVSRLTSALAISDIPIPLPAAFCGRCWLHMTELTAGCKLTVSRCLRLQMSEQPSGC